MASRIFRDFFNRRSRSVRDAARAGAPSPDAAAGQGAGPTDRREDAPGAASPGVHRAPVASGPTPSPIHRPLTRALSAGRPTAHRPTPHRHPAPARTASTPTHLSPDLAHTLHNAENFIRSLNADLGNALARLEHGDTSDALMAFVTIWTPPSSTIALQTTAAGASPIQRALQASEQTREDDFQKIFRREHAGSVQTMQALVDTLRARKGADVPPGGITAQDIDDRDGAITYKLPALLLAQHLPQLCEHGGTLPELALFDAPWQKRNPQTQRPYASLLPGIHARLLDMHGRDAERLAAAVPALAKRMSRLLEGESPEMSAEEKVLAGLIRDAAYQIFGKILYETMGLAFAHLPNA